MLSKQHPLNARVGKARQGGFENGCSERSAALLAQVRVCANSNRTNTNPNDTETNATGRSVRACDARKSN